VLSSSRHLTIILLASPESQNASIGLKIAGKAVDRGYIVRIFLHGEAVGIARVNDPRFNSTLKTLIDKGVEVRVCAQCAAARGYVDNDLRSRELNERVIIGGFSDLATYLKVSDRVLSIS
jgi:sulfur relay (sulfurtransferase) complex TusBCD TusD component (DsrE family)